jgi:unsaturated rhamnogalacturonyl hydrolase
MINTENNSRRNFLKKAGEATAVIAGVTVTGFSCTTADSVEKDKNNGGTVFKGRATSLADRIERVKIAAIGMQRYDWEQGTLAQAFLEYGDYEMTISLARAAIMRQENGRFSVLKGNGPITDCSSVGEAVLFSGTLTGDPMFKKAADEMLAVFKTSDHKDENGILYHTQEPTKWMMSDANYMLPPFLAACGEYQEAIKQIDGWRSYLYNDREKLYSHIWDCENNKFKREDFWGTGSGWSAAGFVRVIDMLPDSMMEDKKKLIGYVNDLLEGGLKYMREDGAFHDVVNNPDTFLEVNLSQMMAYTIFRGVAAGYVDSNLIEKAELMRKASNDRVDEYGYIHDVCGCPHFDRSYFSPEAQAFYILMESAARDLAKK